MKYWAVAFWLLFLFGIGYVAGYVRAMDISTAQYTTPADPVKEYAMNRLCQISIGECVRLAHAAIRSEKAQ